MQILRKPPLGLSHPFSPAALQRPLRSSVNRPRTGHSSVRKQGCQGLSFMVDDIHFFHEWERLPGVSSWVLHADRSGYTLQFGCEPPPPFDGVHQRAASSASNASVLRQELSSLVLNGVIEEVPQSDLERVFSATISLCQRGTVVYDPFYTFIVWASPFKMLTLKTIMSQIRVGDWSVTVDLKDAYLHRKFLRFAFGGKAYQYKVLPFGLALVLRMFTKCMDAALAPLRLQGIRVLNYLDDWLILVHSRESVSCHRDVVLRNVCALGLRTNTKKSVLSTS